MDTKTCMSSFQNAAFFLYGRIQSPDSSMFWSMTSTWRLLYASAYKRWWYQVAFPFQRLSYNDTSGIVWVIHGDIPLWEWFFVLYICHDYAHTVKLLIIQICINVNTVSRRIFCNEIYICLYIYEMTSNNVSINRKLVHIIHSFIVHRALTCD